MMDECWRALTLAICGCRFLTPEQAFEHLAIGKKPAGGRRGKNGMTAITDDDEADMLSMKIDDKMTYKQIGQLYGLKADAVYNRIRRHKGIIP